MKVSTHLPDHIKAASRTLGFALWMKDPNEWAGFAAIVRARVSVIERKLIATLALNTLSHEQACEAFQAAFPQAENQPIAPLFNHMDEAAFWASMAESEALEAYCLAGFYAMSAKRQADFLKFIQGRAAA